MNANTYTAAATDHAAISAQRAAPAGAFELLRRLIVNVAKHYAAQRDYDHLLTLSQHQLNDIGQTRGDVLRMKATSPRLLDR